MQRRALALLFAAIALCLGVLAAYALVSGGRAIIVGIAAGGLSIWMADLARRVWPSP